MWGVLAGVVIELFTSQGCSSCPPADAVLSGEGMAPDVIALAFHVDYWNDLGWNDPFSAAAWTERQRAYDRAIGSNTYTPQMVVGGTRDVLGSSKSRVEAAITEARKKKPAGTVKVNMSRQPSGALHAQVAWTLAEPPRHELRVMLAVSESGLITPVLRGENGDRTLQNDFVVRRLEKIGTVTSGTDGTVNAAVTLDPAWKQKGLRLVALLQDSSSMEILAADASPISSP